MTDSELDKASSPADVKHEQKAVEEGVDNDSLEMTPEESKKLKRRIDLAIVPYCTLLYLLSFLDRINIGQAKTAGLEAALGLSDHQYQVCLIVFFVSYVAFEIPSNLALKKLKPHRWITFIMIVWSIVQVCMGLVENYAGLAATRFFLGLAEGGLFPGINFMLTCWYRRQEQNVIISIFFAGATLAGAFGGILAFGIRHMDGVGGKGGWAWIFILEGLLTFVCALPCWWLIQDFPEDAKILNDSERKKWLHRLYSNQGVTTAPIAYSHKQALRPFKEWRTYVYALLYIGIAQPLYSLALFTPTIIGAFGFSEPASNLLTVPPYVLGFIITMLNAWFSDRYLMRGPFLVCWLSIAIIAYIILLTDVSAGVKYFAVFLAVSGVSPSIPTAISYVGANFGPVYSRASAMGLFFTVGNSAGIISSVAYPARDSPRFIRGHAIALAFAAMAIVCCVTLSIANRRENARRDREYGVPAEDGSDLSPMNGSLEKHQQKWGYEGLSLEEIIEQGNHHKAFRYVW